MSLTPGASFVAIIVFALMSGCADGERESIASDGAPALRTHFTDQGNGEAVVLVHGFSQTHAAWLQTPLYEDLVRDHRLVAIDLRGHGDSDKPHDPLAYGPNLHKDLVELLDHLNIDKAHFVGFSLGASVLGDLVVSVPDRVQTATMVSGYFTTWDEAEEEFARMIESQDPEGERYPWEPENQDYRALAAVIRGTRYSAVGSEQIAAINTPTLMAFGSIEVEHMTESGRERLSSLPGSVAVLIIEGADHDSSGATILSPEFSQAARDLIASNATH